MVTPIVRAAPMVDALPIWLQWHVRPFGEFTIFTLLPWAGFVFAGGAVGALIAAAREATARSGGCTRSSARAAWRWSLLGFYTAGRPSIYASSSFWTELADLVCDPARDPDDCAHRDLCLRDGTHGAEDPRRRTGAPVVSPAIDPLAQAGPQLALRLLDPRRAGLRLRELGVAPPAAALGHRHRVRAVLQS